MTNQPQLTVDTIVCRSQDQVSSDVEGETAIMSIAKGNYYMLNEVGARVWTLIDEPRRIGDVCQSLLAEYETDQQNCEEEIVRLVKELVEQELVEVVDATPS